MESLCSKEEKESFLVVGSENTECILHAQKFSAVQSQCNRRALHTLGRQYWEVKNHPQTQVQVHITEILYWYKSYKGICAAKTCFVLSLCPSGAQLQQGQHSSDPPLHLPWMYCSHPSQTLLTDCLAWRQPCVSFLIAFLL